ncbi:MAG: Ig-like domain-containing protein, partial [Clostridia bacterium]|nr:Ig-like domain-containing protein [Clostridia bacterium]
DKNGVLKGIEVGTVKLTATVHNYVTNKDIVAECTVNVIPGPHTIKFANTRTTIGYGETMDLKPVAYNKNGEAVETTFTYKSSNTRYVTLKDNGVYGKAKGTSTITVTAENGVSATVTIKTVNAPTKVTVSADSVNLAVGEKTQAHFTLPSGQDGAVTWKAEHTNILKIDQNGVITALSKGKTRIRVDTFNKKYALLTINVVDSPESISFEKATYKLGEGETFKPVLTVKPAGAASNVKYEVIGSKLFTVSKDGTVTAKTTTGKATLRATTHNYVTNKDIVCECEIEVVPAPVKVEILTKVTTIGYKEKLKIEAVAYDASGNVIDGRLKLTTSNSRYVQVNDKMEIYGAYRGSATIGVSAYNGVLATVKITVKSAPGSVSLDKTELDVIIGQTPKQLKATLPSGTASQITWETENSAIATIDKNGKITPVSYGTVRVRAVTFNGKYKICTVNVFEAPKSVTLSKHEASLAEGQTLTLTASLNAKAAGAITFTSSDKAVATVDANGKVTAVSEGTATITAKTYNGKTDTCKVTVKKAASKVEFTLASITIGVKQKVDVSPLVEIPSGTAAGFTYAVESKSIATIDANGVVTGVKVGKTRIKVMTHNGHEAIMSVDVKAAPTQVTLTIGNSRLYIGETSEYKVSLGDIVSEYTITSNAPGIVRVDTENHRLIAVSKGKATITAQAYNGVIKTAVVEVLKHVESVSLNKTSLSLVHHETFQLKASVLPEDASDRSVTWASSDPEKVSVSANGLVTALKVTNSPVTITVRTKDKNLSATCTVEVKPVRVTGVKLNHSEYTLSKTVEHPLIATVTPSNADDRTLIWTSSNSELASVNANGVVTAHGHEGTVTITVTTKDGGFKDECVITLQRLAMKSMALLEPSVSIAQYDTHQIVPVFTPAKAEYKSIVYESLNQEIVKVSASGLLEAVSVGTGSVKVTVTDYFGSVYTAQCAVAVVPVPVKSVEMSLTDFELRAGKTAEVTVVVKPDNAFNKQVKWTTSNKNVATVTVDPNNNHKATITAISGGEAVITVTAADSGVKDTVKVVVFNALGLSLTPNHASNSVGNTISWTADALNEVNGAKYTFKVVKEGQAEPVINITEFGTKNVVSITDAKAGKYTATVTVKDGLNDTCVKSSTIVVSERILFTSGSDKFTYVILPGAAANGGDGAAIKYSDPGAAPAKVVIPALVNGVPVVRIDNEAFMNATKLTTVSVPETVTVIGARAFKGCTALTDMTTHTAG